MTRHNKKRNTGLLYEFLVRTISDAIIEGNDNKKNTALSIVRKHFRPGCELHKEFRLFHSLVATTVQSPSVADTILEAVKQASKQFNDKKLDHEKSLLIRSINHNINEKNFYDRRLPESEYQTYATIQTLLNEWRSGDFSNIVRMAQFEEQLKEWLLQDKNISSIDESSISSADPLVEKLMVKKINDKYKDQLTNEQSEIIRSYLFSKSDEDFAELKENLKSIKQKALESIQFYLAENAGKDKFLDEKLNKARQLINEENVDNISNIEEKRLEKFLDIVKLSEEIG